jgi:VanZ family protein
VTRRRWIPPIAWAAVILTLTSIPASDLAPVGAFAFPGADKLVHVGMYGVLGALLARAVGVPPSPRTLGRLLLGVLLFAAVDEWHQRFIPGRSADVLDLVADLAGATLGVAAAARFLRRGFSEP